MLEDSREFPKFSYYQQRLCNLKASCSSDRPDQFNPLLWWDQRVHF